MVVPSTEQNFAKEMAIGFGVGVKQVGGVEHMVAGTARMDPAGEAKVFQDLVKSKKAAAGITLFMHAADVFAPLIAEARAQNVPMIAVDNKFDATSKVPLYVGNDNYALGQMLADQAISRLPADAAGDIVLGTPLPGVPVLEFRAKGMRDQFTKRLPKVNVIGPFDTKTDPLVNRATWQKVVAAHPRALGFFGTGDADGYNLASIRKATRGTWLAGAYDLDPRSLQAVKDGSLLLVSPEHFVKGAVAGRVQAQHAKDGKPMPEGWIYTPGLAITKANVDDIIERQESEDSKAAWFKPQIDTILSDRKTYLRPLSEAR
jgi:ribose transport system substrate-binding protein